MNIEAMKTTAQSAIDAASAALRDVNLAIHANPELNFEEYSAHEVLTNYLEAQRFHVERGAYGMATAFKAVAGSGSPTVAVLCEYDALPGIGHACGHNLIAVCGVAAGMAIRDALPAGEGTVVVLGSPAEEGGGGKIVLIEQGAFKGIDFAMMAHPAPGEAAYMNVLAVEHINVEYRGRNAHAAASPWAGINALDAMILAFNNISAMRQQMLPSDRVHGVITDGGVKPNIIPDFTSAEFYIRARKRSELDTLRKKVMGCFEGAATASGCTLTVVQTENGRPYSDMIANDVLAEAYTENLAAFGIRVPTKQQVLSGPGGSTDMGDVSYVVPSIHPMFAIPAEAGNHTAGFTSAAATEAAHEAAMRTGKTLAMTALEVFADPEKLVAMKREFAGLRR